MIKINPVTLPDRRKVFQTLNAIIEVQIFFLLNQNIQFILTWRLTG
jgi:hypothetical protein